MSKVRTFVMRLRGQTKTIHQALHTYPQISGVTVTGSRQRKDGETYEARLTVTDPSLEPHDVAIVVGAVNHINFAKVWDVSHSLPS